MDNDNANRRRGVITRMLGFHTLSLSVGWNKLIEEYRLNRRQYKEKLETIIRALSENSTKSCIFAYNSMKKRHIYVTELTNDLIHFKKQVIAKKLLDKIIKLRRLSFRFLITNSSALRNFGLQQKKIIDRIFGNSIREMEGYWIK